MLTALYAVFLPPMAKETARMVERVFAAG